MGINPGTFTGAFDSRNGMGSRGTLWPVIDSEYNKFDVAGKRDALCALASRLIAHNHASREEAVLANFGYRFSNGLFAELGD